MIVDFEDIILWSFSNKKIEVIKILITMIIICKDGPSVINSRSNITYILCYFMYYYPYYKYFNN